MDQGMGGSIANIRSLVSGHGHFRLFPEGMFLKNFVLE
jgi:hypothetical protein